VTRGARKPPSAPSLVSKADIGWVALLLQLVRTSNDRKCRRRDARKASYSLRDFSPDAIVYVVAG
jgi:hypothetical protein